jgi:hypothetical protein
VLPAWETDEAMRNGNGNGAPTIYNTVVHMPPGTPTSTFRLMRRYQRRNGLEVFV